MGTKKNQYLSLEKSVHADLRSIISKSKVQSKHVSSKAIKVDHQDYKELTIVNDDLTFIDSRGLHYSIYADTTLEDLIDILESHS